MLLNTATTKKANSSLAFLRRNLASCPREVKARCYRTLTKPILEYANSAWDPHYTAYNINQLEAVQRRAARFAIGNYKTTSSTSQMTADLGWQTLQQCRVSAKLVMMYKIVYQLVDIPTPCTIFRPIISGTRGHLQVPSTTL